MPAGDVQTRVVGPTYRTLVAETPPNETVAPATKLVPVTVTVVPPAIGPAFGLTEPTVGNGVNVYSCADVVAVLEPPGVVTVTPTVPAASVGGVAVTDPSLLTVNDDAALVPKSTTVASVKPDPVIVTGEPPDRGPALGLIPVTIGIGKYVNWSATDVALVPPSVVTVISTGPADSAGETAEIDVALPYTTSDEAIEPK